MVWGLACCVTLIYCDFNVLCYVFLNNDWHLFNYGSVNLNILIWACLWEPWSNRCMWHWCMVNKINRTSLTVVSGFCSELERLSTLVGRPSESHPLHNSGLLSLDPVQDKTPLYSQLLQAYKWSNKVSCQHFAGSPCIIAFICNTHRWFKGNGLKFKWWMS